MVTHGGLKVTSDSLPDPPCTLASLSLASKLPLPQSVPDSFCWFGAKIPILEPCWRGTEPLDIGMWYHESKIMCLVLQNRREVLV